VQRVRRILEELRRALPIRNARDRTRLLERLMKIIRGNVSHRPSYRESGWIQYFQRTSI